MRIAKRRDENVEIQIHLPFDIQVQILERLPVKSLIRFTSVCKAWKSLINSSEFIAGYRVPPNQPHHLLIRYEEVGDPQKPEVKTVCFVDDDTFPQQRFVPTLPPLLKLLNYSEIIDSSCGLLCLDGVFSEPDNSFTEMLLLWNPSIRKSIAVAVPHDLPPLFKYVTGFGVCPHTMDPKLVKITYIDNYFELKRISCIPCQVMVFTLSSGKWTSPSCTNLPRKSIEFASSPTVVIGHFIYWVAYDRLPQSQHSYMSQNLIMSFHMTTQEFTEVDLPHCFGDLSLCRLRGSLAMVECCVKDLNSTWQYDCAVWIMEQQGDSKPYFTNLFTITAPNASVSRTLEFRETGQPLVEIQYVKDAFAPFGLVVYQPCSNHIKDLGFCGKDFWGGSYTDSLLLLDHHDGHVVRCGAVKT